MKLEFAEDEISVKALLECFSIPSNAKYLFTEIGIANKPHQIQARDNNRTHTLFSMFSSDNQKRFINSYISSAKLIVKNATEFEKNCEFVCSFTCAQFENQPIELGIKLRLTKEKIDAISAYAISAQITEDELRSIPLILTLLMPN